MIRRLFRLALYLFIILVVLLVAGILLLDTIAREVTQNRIRSETGMEAKIGKMRIGLLSPTVTIENFKLYNTPEFGGSQCLDIPELHIEYDVQAARAGKLHLRLVRLNMAEIDVLQDKNGHSNFDQLQKRNATVLSGKSAPSKPVQSTNRPPFEFAGIDTLNLTLQKAHFARIDAPHHERDINFGIKNQLFYKIKNEGDFIGVAAVISLRMGALNGGAGDSLNGALKGLLP